MTCKENGTTKVIITSLFRLCLEKPHNTMQGTYVSFLIFIFGLVANLYVYAREEYKKHLHRSVWGKGLTYDLSYL